MKKHHRKRFCLGVYLGGKEACSLLLEEWADLLEVGAAANVGDVWAFLHAWNERAFSHADQSGAALLGQLASPLVKERTFAR